MATKGYQSYHGRMPGWKKLLIGVLLLILIAAVGFLFLQKYQVFDQDGAHFRLPWAGQAQADPSAEEELDDDDVIVDVQEPVSVLEELRGRTLPAETLDAALDCCLPAGGRAPRADHEGGQRCVPGRE